jgi:regulation of enolase protein 1 (concanavalin A-like superfamily)
LSAAGATRADAQSLPSPWVGTDIGAPLLTGSGSVSSGTFTLVGSGSDIGGSSDQFFFVYQPVQGDTEIVARVASLEGPNDWSKAGVMIRASLTGNSQNVLVTASVGKGWMFTRRLSVGASTLSNRPMLPGVAPGWVRLVREGNLFSGYYSVDGSSWTLLGSDTISMGSTVYVGLAVTSRHARRTAKATYSNVTVGAPTGDNRSPSVSISSPSNGATFTAPPSIAIAAAASDSDGTVTRVDFFRDGTLIGSDTNSPFGTTWSSPPPGDHLLTAVATDNGGGTATSAPVVVSVTGSTNQPPSVSLTSPANAATFSAPANITLAATASDADGTISRVDFFQGSTLVGSDTTSPYSATWSSVPAGSYSLTAVATDNAGATRTSAAAGVTVTSSSSTLPAPWLHRDVGNPTLAGQASLVNGIFTVTGAGIDIWGTTDQFHFVYQQVQGDTEIIARVASFQGPHSWSKAGVMVRGDLTGSAPHASMLATVGSDYAFQYRTTAGGDSSHTAGSAGTAPGWVRLVRTGSLFTAYHSTDGGSWSTIGSVTISMATTVYVGLAVTSHDASASATSTFGDVVVRTPSGNQAPSVSLTSPSSGATFTAPANITLAATASDSDGTVSKVDFYRGSTLIGSDTTSPYSVTWSSVPAGGYTLTAVATDNGGATRTSASVSITVNTTNQLPSVSITAPVNGATFVAPASVGIAASASDPDGSVAGVDFYAGTALIGTDTTNPFGATWSNVAAGTYSLTAIARDDRGASRTSASVTITVAAGLQTFLAFAPSADHATLVTSYSVALRRSTDSVTATPVATRDLGKPAVVNGEISVDISTLVNPLPAGSYYAVVTAIGSGGSSSSSPSPTFTK